MLLRRIQTVLIVLFVLVAAAFCGLLIYNYLQEDISPPVFTCQSDTIEVSVDASDAELCAGLNAWDNIDGDLTDKIMIKSITKQYDSDEAIITYLVFDNAANSATYSRTLRYTDYAPPRFQLQAPLIYRTGASISLTDKLLATDVIDGDISGKILLTQSSVDSSEPGAYEIVAQVTNSAGDTSRLPLTVLVQDISDTTPSITLKEYLRYVKAGQSVDFAANVVEVADPAYETPLGPETVAINSQEVNLNVPGVYEVTYSYTSDAGETVSTIFTLVVE